MALSISEQRRLILAHPIESLETLEANRPRQGTNKRKAEAAASIAVANIDKSAAETFDTADCTFGTASEKRKNELPPSHRTNVRAASIALTSLSSAETDTSRNSCGKSGQRLFERQGTMELLLGFFPSLTPTTGSNIPFSADNILVSNLALSGSESSVYLDDQDEQHDQSFAESDTSMDGKHFPHNHTSPGLPWNRLDANVSRQVLNQSYYSQFIDTRTIKSSTADEPVVEDAPMQDDDVDVNNWNERFQTAMVDVTARSSYTERVAANTRLINVFRDFVSACETYGRVILSEVALPHHLKTIRPNAGFGGVAGGLKYVVQGVLFKVASGETELYQGDEALAAKVVGHDLKGVTHFFNTNVKGLHFPLSVLLDFHGYRCVCQSILPISSSTQVYGTSNQAQTPPLLPLSTDPFPQSRLPVLLKQVATKLNLKQHTIRGTPCFCACDIEGHCGYDNRLYMLDLARSMPPVAPHTAEEEALEGRKPRRLKHLVRLFRFEFLRTYPVPLSPDAFSGFARLDPECEPSNAEIEHATNYLHRVKIPEFCEAFLLRDNITAFDLHGAMHDQGINMRYLGRVFRLLRGQIKLQCACEMVARSLKSIFRADLRRRTRQLRYVLVEPYRRLAVEFLNLAFGCFGRVITSEKDTMQRARLRRAQAHSSAFWSGHVRTALHDLFGVEFEESSAENLRACLLPSVNELKEVFGRFGTMTGFKLVAESPKTDLLANNPSFFFGQIEPFVDSDIYEVAYRVRTLSFVDHSAGYIHKMRARSEEGDQFRKFYLQLAKDNFERSIRINPNKVSLRNAGQVCSDLLELIWKQAEGAVSEDAVALLLEAQAHFARCLMVDPDDFHSLAWYGELLASCGLVEDAELFLLRALLVSPMFTDALNTYSLILQCDTAPPEDVQYAHALDARLAEILGNSQSSLEQCSRCHRPGHTALFCRTMEIGLLAAVADAARLATVVDHRLWGSEWYDSHMEALRTKQHRAALTRVTTTWN